MGHDEGSYESCRHTPRGGPDVLRLVVLVQEGDVERLGKVLAEEVARAALQGLAVLHHRLDGVSVQRSGEALGLALHALKHGDGHPVLREVGIYLQHLLCLGFGFLAGGVRGVAFLPQEFACAQEWARAHLPSHYIAPLVAQQWQVAPRVYPVFVCIPYYGLRGGADNQFFFQTGGGVYFNSALVFFGTEAVVGHYGAFLGKTFNVFGFFRQERLWYKEREVCVLHACLLEHRVQLMLHLFPYCVAVWLDYHAAPYSGLLCEVGFHDEVVVPLAIVVSPFS